MSFRLAAYGVCDAVIREVAEKTRVRITGGRLRPEPNGDIAEWVWTAV